jgi:hypothetical protein
MTAVEILYWCLVVVQCILFAINGRLVKKTRQLNDELEGDIGCVKLLAEDLPKIVPCYECKFYQEGEPFCPKSGMKMKGGLIYCCYGEREDSDGRND